MTTDTTTTADAQRERGVALETYRHLRMILIALPALMLVASVGMFLTQRSIQGSISAYYTGPLRDVFVGMLVGLAACLIAYRGAPLEDYALNMAGFYALFVAFVPLSAHLDALEGEAYDAAVAGIRLVTVSALLVTVAFLVAEWRTGHWTGRTLAHRTTTTKAVYRGFTAVGLAYVVLLGVRIVEGSDFAGVHITSAILLVASLTVAVGTHAFPRLAGEELLKKPHLGWYRTIAGLMSLGLAVVVPVTLLLGAGEHLGLVVEWWEIVLFAIFWTRETQLNWNGEPERASTGEPQGAGA